MLAEIGCLAEQGGETGECADPGLMFEIAQLKRGYLQLQAIEIVVLLLLLIIIIIIVRGNVNRLTFHRGLIHCGQDAETCNKEIRVVDPD
jgi:hypothetical protein